MGNSGVKRVAGLTVSDVGLDRDEGSRYFLV